MLTGFLTALMAACWQRWHCSGGPLTVRRFISPQQVSVCGLSNGTPAVSTFIFSFLGSPTQLAVAALLHVQEA